MIKKKESRARSRGVFRIEHTSDVLYLLQTTYNGIFLLYKETFLYIHAKIKNTFRIFSSADFRKRSFGGLRNVNMQTFIQNSHDTKQINSRYFHATLPENSPYSVQMRENTDQKNSEYGYFSRSVKKCYGGFLTCS